MPRTLYQEDGTPVDVPDEQELQTYTEKVANYDKEKAEWEVEKKNLEAEVNPNWKEMRAREKQWKEREAQLLADLEKSGAKPTDDKPLTREEIERISEEKARKVAIDSRKKSLLNQYGEKEREVVENYFNKFSAGEELTEEKVAEHMAAAERAAGLRPASRPVISGRPPVLNPKGQVTEAAREMADAFGIDQKELEE